MGFKAGYCPESERFHKETLSIPIFPALLFEDHSHVINSLNEILTTDEK
jgi:dTDP-4-amino-4,6-dideoxygalactose transaminase